MTKLPSMVFAMQILLQHLGSNAIDMQFGDNDTNMPSKQCIIIHWKQTLFCIVPMLALEGTLRRLFCSPSTSRCWSFSATGLSHSACCTLSVDLLYPSYVGGKHICLQFLQWALYKFLNCMLCCCALMRQYSQEEVYIRTIYITCEDLVSVFWLESQMII
jgi:hypothetical protein